MQRDGERERTIAVMGKRRSEIDMNGKITGELCGGMNDAERIRATLPTGELLAQLAEEAAELSQAALKLRRAIEGVNPTATDAKEWDVNLREEIADVMACVDVLGYGETERAWIVRTKQEKVKRWAFRLFGGD